MFARLRLCGSPQLLSRGAGVVFRIATAEERALDEAEGVGHGYRKVDITVVTFERTLAAMAYFATEKDGKRRPYDCTRPLSFKERQKTRFRPLTSN
jgi:hypothetical protein